MCHWCIEQENCAKRKWIIESWNLKSTDWINEIQFTFCAINVISNWVRVIELIEGLKIFRKNNKFAHWFSSQFSMDDNRNKSIGEWLPRRDLSCELVSKWCSGLCHFLWVFSARLLCLPILADVWCCNAHMQMWEYID